eukprot:CAMPEP_0116980206 /NCGR_PEP_ID=MMETSP0467-20121206/58932_1 /TAXON_ID=283647 /ORGANISM="Mesodinium pulex, Strain SPMC105" /LENGTH=93 /DNA_ID=CAMNT_0004674109 /DNA_START=591 /DNA_END=869 /DNA_ORIENTATION=-
MSILIAINVGVFGLLLTIIYFYINKKYSQYYPSGVNTGLASAMSFVNINGLIENNDNVTQDVITDTATTPTTATTNINLENQNNVPVIGTDNN